MEESYWDDLAHRAMRGLAIAAATLILCWAQSYVDYPAWQLALALGVFSMIGRIFWAAKAALTFLLLLVLIPPRFTSAISDFIIRISGH